MLVIALVGEDNAPRKRAHAHLPLAWKVVVASIGILHRRRAILRGLIQALKAFLGELQPPMLLILFEPGPQPFVGRRHLPNGATGQLRGQMVAGAHFGVQGAMQRKGVARFAVREGILAHGIERVAVGYLRLPEQAMLLRRRQQFELGRKNLTHLSCPLLNHSLLLSLALVLLVARPATA